jgi:hypothetical protein
MPIVDADDIIRTIQSDYKLIVKEYNVEIDSRLFEEDVKLSEDEIAALLIHDIAAMVSDSAPAEEVKRALDKYLQDNHEVLKLSDSIHYKEILSYGFRDAMRKVTTAFEKAEVTENDLTVFELVPSMEAYYRSGFEKVEKQLLVYNAVANTKFLVLSWVMRLYKDVLHNRIAALHTIAKCMEMTPSQLEKKELSNLARRLNRIDDDSLLESALLQETRGTLYNKLSQPLEVCEDKCNQIKLQVQDSYNEPDVIPDLIHSINNQLTLIDDHVKDDPTIDKHEYKQWNSIFKDMVKARHHLEGSRATFFAKQQKMYNTWKGQLDQ